MTPLIRSETRKAFSSNAIWWLLLAGVGIVGVSTYVTVALNDASGSALLSDDNVKTALHGGSAGAYLMAVVGVMAVAGEWRTGQASQTFLSSAQRWRVIAAKIQVYFGVGLVYGAVAASVTLAAVWGAYRAEGLTLALDRSAVWYPLLGVVVGSMLVGLLGLAIGAILRNQIIGIVGILVWMLVIESIIYTASETVGRWLPGIATVALAGFPDEGYLHPVMAGIVLAGATVAALMAATWVVEKSDVTA